MKLLSENIDLARYQPRIEQQLKVLIEKLGPPSALRDACEYALLSGGKRFRPALVMLIAESVGLSCDACLAGLAIECFHTASLIADDLPSMDNDNERRNLPSTHVKFGESTALLASYALIAAGYELLAENALEMDDSQRGVLALQLTSKNTGLQGACGGQYLDLSPPSLSKEVILDVIHKKTVTLFEIAFCYGWIFGNGDLSQLPLVKKCARHFGMAFQIADDLNDTDQDVNNGRQINLANFIGKDEAVKMFHVERLNFISCAEQLGLGRLLLVK